MGCSKNICAYCGKRFNQGRPSCPHCGRAVLRNVGGGRFRLVRAVSLVAGCVTFRGVDGDTRQPLTIRVVQEGASPGEQRRVTYEAAFLRDHGGRAPFPRFLASGRVPTTRMPYTILECVPGPTLFEAGKGLGVVERVELVLRCLGALAELHDMGFVHRGLAPGGFVLPDTSEVFFTDLREVVRSGEDAYGGGVPGFQAPELGAFGTPVTPAADVFAMGACVYKLLTGLLPYPPDRRKPLELAGFRPKLPSAVKRDVPGILDHIVLRALERGPERRFADAQAMRAELSRAFGTATVVDDLDIEFESALERFGTGLSRAGSWLWRGLGIPAALLRRLLRFLGRPVAHLPRPAALLLKCLLIAGGLAAILVLVMTFGTSTCNVVTPLPSQVYVNGSYAGSAPSPAVLILPPGRNALSIKDEAGRSVAFEFWCWPGQHRLISVDPVRKAYAIAQPDARPSTARQRAEW